MKKLFEIFGIIFLLGMPSCENERSLKEEVQNDFVSNTFTEGLPDGVESVQIVTKQHPILEEAIASDHFKKSEIEFENTYPIYSNYVYKDGTSALLIEDQSGKIVFVYLYQTSNLICLDAFKAEINIEHLKSTKSQTGASIISIRSLKTEFVLFECTLNELQTKSWGSCMKGAMKLLYDDWDADPIGTFACWATGAQCAIGGAIACGIKQL
jgi:hypothetical protein